MSERYVLDDNHQPVPCEDLLKWGRWMNNNDAPRVALTKDGDSTVSTVFLGLDHRFAPGTPVLFETMVFGGPLADEQERYSTWDEAVAGHNAMVERVKAAHAAATI